MDRRRLVLALLVGVALPGLLVGPATSKPNPPGNNGTVKIDGLAFDDPDHPDNEPHVGCWFQVDFYVFWIKCHDGVFPPGEGGGD